MMEPLFLLRRKKMVIRAMSSGTPRPAPSPAISAAVKPPLPEPVPLATAEAMADEVVV